MTKNNFDQKDLESFTNLNQIKLPEPLKVLPKILLIFLVVSCGEDSKFCGNLSDCFITFYRL